MDVWHHIRGEALDYLIECLGRPLVPAEREWVEEKWLGELVSLKIFSEKSSLLSSALPAIIRLLLFDLPRSSTLELPFCWEFIGSAALVRGGVNIISSACCLFPYVDAVHNSRNYISFIFILPWK
jgi:hypothetical protein